MKKSIDGAGDVWTWTAIDADSKLIVAHFCWDRDAYCANEFINDLPKRLVTGIQLTSGGLKVYLEAVEGALGADVDYAQLVKQLVKMYSTPQGANNEKRYSPAECNGIKKKVVEGEPDESYISTSYVECSNLTMRMHDRRFTQLTNAFSKKFENHAHMVAIYAM